MSRIRVSLLSGAAKGAFPFQFSVAEIERRFEIVTSRPDVIVLQILNQRAFFESVSLAPSFSALDGGTPTVLFHEMDRWDEPGAWHDEAGALAHRADLVFGHQLSNDLDPRRFHPLMLPPFMGDWGQAIHLVEPRERKKEIDISFVGSFTSPGEDVDLDEVRTREARGLALSVLRAGLSPRWRLHIDRRRYWKTPKYELPELMSSYGDILDRSAVVFSPPGYGYNCTRHAEAWAHGCVLLAPRLHERILVEAPEMWESEQMYVGYEWDLSDLVEKAEHAATLSDRSRTDMLTAGRRYYESFCTIRGQVDRVADLILERLFAQ